MLHFRILFEYPENHLCRSKESCVFRCVAAAAHFFVFWKREYRFMEQQTAKQAIYSNHYAQIDATKNEALDAACREAVATVGALRASVPLFQALHEEQWSSLRSSLILCNLHVIKFAGAFELTVDDGVVEAVMSVPYATLDSDDLERLTVIADVAQSLCVLPCNEKCFVMVAKYALS